MAAPQDIKEKVIKELNAIFDAVDLKINANPQLADLVRKTGQRPAHVAVGVVLVAFVAVLFGFGPHALTNLIGFAYPMYLSFKALQTDEKDDDTFLLTYWVAYGFFTVIEGFVAILFKSFFYYVFKSAFLVWLYLPQTKGAQLVYLKVILPILNRYESDIDRQLGSAKSAVDQAQSEMKGDVTAAVAGAVQAGKKKATAAAIDAMIAEAAEGAGGKKSS